ncbi:trehalose synthase [Solirubrobacter sp. CPCC 204708]|uniref:Alpha-amylase family protein n=1 Tax=Solirubrobacter deserti TaxID=2282478 RepID=A0ABT4RDS5_9ACTN|nr:alpha-amylase family protein [Solirubrobacter deserti]MBE2314663.1 trehalose synthase [Solirubrobacter deserti]MDA0136670.1 alpha-amylase family protein [Solirubrobacter deserti]
MSVKTSSDLWWKNAVVYCLDVEMFFDSDGDGCGDLLGLTERVDYLAGLGVSVLWLMPFYPSPNRDDGYDITDFYAVDSSMGTLGDFVELVRTCRDRGIRVIVDFVMNHTSDQHPWFQAARSSKDSPYRDFYVWVDEKPPEKPGDLVFPDAETSNWTYDRKAGQYYQHRFYKHQPDLNLANPAVRDELAQVLGFWLEQGLSGFRVDAVPFLIEGVLDDPHQIIRDLRSYVNRRVGEAVLLGEVNLPAEQTRAFLGDEDGDELHMVLDFIGNQALYLSLARGSAEPLTKALSSYPKIPAAASLGRFVRNHDELTLDKLSEEERAEVFARFGPDESLQLYGRGLRRRLPTMLEGDERALRMVYSLAFSLPGTPVLFYGEEIGMAENVDIEGRYAVRAPMQWARDGGFTLPGVSPRRPMVEGAFGPERVNVTDQRRDPGSLLNWFERLIRRRRECPELGFGSLTLLESGAESVFAHRVDWEDATIVCVHELSGSPATVSLPVGDGERLVDLFDHSDHDLPATLQLEPYAARWFRVARTGVRLPP